MSRKMIPRVFGENTETLRRALRSGDMATHDLAVSALEAQGAKGSRRKWWAFEGFTSVDCVLETDRLLVFIEGKRTEKISAATDWYPRNQIVRNLEVASCVAHETDKDIFGVIPCTEAPVIVPEHVFCDRLPHLSE
jgi:hypothetical protein